MTVSLILEMASTVEVAACAIVDGDQRVDAVELDGLAERGAGLLLEHGAAHVAYLGTGGAMLPTSLFSAAKAGLPFTPLNYRLGADALRALIERLPTPVVIVDQAYREMVEDLGAPLIVSEDFVRAASTATPANRFPDAEDVAVVLFTSGTTSSPKAVELTHRNLASYVMGTVDFGSAAPSDAALICVPPYHIAGIGACLSNLYAGRRLVYLRQFDAREWLRLVEAESITTATVVPTMLDRIVSELESEHAALPTLRNLAYGGSKVPLPLIRKALDLMPHVGFVNAYGLTETSSTVTLLTPEEHRVAYTASDPVVARRLGSAGRAAPGVELQIRADDGSVLGPDESGELFVRGDQVSGRYTGVGSVLDGDGWFPTRDIASLDADGYLYVEGRSDDTIIRGGENIAPAELEDVLHEHPLVHACAVVGPADPQWGQSIVAVVVPTVGATPEPEELRTYVRAALRGSRTPDRIVFRAELPTNATGKVLRRQLIDELESTSR